MAKKTIFEKLGLSEKTEEAKASEDVKKDQVAESLNQKATEGLEQGDILKEESDLKTGLEIQEKGEAFDKDVLSITESDNLLQKKNESDNKIDLEHLKVEDILEKEDEDKIENSYALEVDPIDLEQALSQTLPPLDIDAESLLENGYSEESNSLQKAKEALSEMKNWSDAEEQIEEQKTGLEETLKTEEMNTVSEKNIDEEKFLTEEKLVEPEGGAVVDNTQLDSKDVIQSVADIYAKSQMEVDKLKTIFMVDQFQKTLPENLPVDVKRTSVTNIINVSNMNLDNLLNDAYKRMDSLNQVLEQSAQKTDDIISAKQTDIEKLEQEIGKLQQSIKERKRFQDEQTSIIEYEVQRIVGIVDFIKPQR